MFLSIGLFFDLQAQDFTHLHLDLSFDTLQSEVAGTVHLRFTDYADSLWLNAVDIEVEKLWLNQRPQAYLQNDTAILLDIGTSPSDTLELKIQYRAKPRKGLYFLGWDDASRRAKRQIWTQGQGIDHRHWIPHRDDQRDKIIYSAHYQFQKDYQLMSNGKLDSTREEGNLKHWYYSMDKPMSSYLIALVIGDYDTLQTFSASGVPLWQYYYPERAADYPIYYAHNEEIFDFLESEIAVAYPWSNYKQAPVCDFRHGAMENTTATIFGDFFLVDSLANVEGNYTYVNAHELAHQWFGNLVTSPGSKHHWLHEGFATYYQWLSEGALYGQDHFDWLLIQAQEQIVAAAEQDSFPLAHPQAGSTRFYQKGAWFLHLIRNRVGDEAFRQGIKDYLHQFAYQVADSDDFQARMEASCACSLEDLFQQYLYSGRELSISLSERNSIHLKAAVPLKDTLFIETYFDGQRDTLAWSLSEKQLIFSSENYGGFRPLNLGDFLWDYQTDLPDWVWHRHLRDSERFLEKYIALKNIKPHALLPPMWDSLVLDSSLYYPLRLLALQKRMAMKNEHQKLPPFQALLDTVLTLNHLPQLQAEAMLWILRDKDFSISPEGAKQLREQGRSYTVRSLAMQASLDFSDPKANAWLFEERWAQEPGFPDFQLHQLSLYLRALLYRDSAALERLLDYGGLSYGFNTRIQALDYLFRLKFRDSLFLTTLWQAYENPNWKLRKKARELLQAWQQESPQRVENFVQEKLSQYPPKDQARIKRAFSL